VPSLLDMKKRKKMPSTCNNMFTIFEPPVFLCSLVNDGNFIFVGCEKRQEIRITKEGAIVLIIRNTAGIMRYTKY
jgi:hypothetical protein